MNLAEEIKSKSALGIFFDLKCKNEIDEVSNLNK